MKIFYVFIASITISFLMVSIYYYGNVRVKDSSEILDLPLGENIVFAIYDIKYKNKWGGANQKYRNYIKEENDCITITGAIIPIGKDLTKVNSNYYLLDERINKAYKINSAMFKNESATPFINDGFNYDNSGLRGYGCVGNLPRGNYRIIADSNKEFLIYSDKYIELHNE